MDTHAYEARLVERRRELDDRLRRIDGDLGTTKTSDHDQSVEREDDEVLESLGEAGVAELRAIDAALERIANGRFGLCAKCGEEMSAERLAAVPQAALCMECIAAVAEDA